MFKIKRGNLEIVGTLQKFQIGNTEAFFYFPGEIEVTVSQLPAAAAFGLRGVTLEKMRTSFISFPIPGSNDNVNIRVGISEEMGKIDEDETHLIFQNIEVKGKLKYFGGGTQLSYFPFIEEVEVAVPNMNEQMLGTLKTIRLDELKKAKINFITNGIKLENKKIKT